MDRSKTGRERLYPSGHNRDRRAYRRARTPRDTIQLYCVAQYASAHVHQWAPMDTAPSGTTETAGRIAALEPRAIQSNPIQKKLRALLRLLQFRIMTSTTRAPHPDLHESRRGRCPRAIRPPSASRSPQAGGDLKARGLDAAPGAHYPTPVAETADFAGGRYFRRRRRRRRRRRQLLLRPFAERKSRDGHARYIAFRNFLGC